jgi:hypothetical protein
MPHSRACMAVRANHPVAVTMAHNAGQLPKSMTRGQDVVLEGVAEVIARGVTVWVGTDDMDTIHKSACRVRGTEQEPTILAVGDGATLKLGAQECTVITTPGHTPGSICIAVGAAGKHPDAVVTGDTLFIGSVGRTDLPESDVSQMLASLSRLATLDEGTVVLPGHNYAAPPWSDIGTEKQTNGWMQQAVQAAQKAQQTGGGLAASKVASIASVGACEGEAAPCDCCRQCVFTVMAALDGAREKEQKRAEKAAAARAVVSKL